RPRGHPARGTPPRRLLRRLERRRSRGNARREGSRVAGKGRRAALTCVGRSRVPVATSDRHRFPGRPRLRPWQGPFEASRGRTSAAPPVPRQCPRIVSDNQERGRRRGLAVIRPFTRTGGLPLGSVLRLPPVSQPVVPKPFHP